MREENGGLWQGGVQRESPDNEPPWEGKESRRGGQGKLLETGKHVMVYTERTWENNAAKSYKEGGRRGKGRAGNITVRVCGSEVGTCTGYTGLHPVWEGRECGGCAEKGREGSTVAPYRGGFTGDGHMCTTSAGPPLYSLIQPLRVRGDGSNGQSFVN